MLNILEFSYNELLLITTHCSWIVKKKKIILTNYLFSHFSLLFPLSFLSSLSWWLWSCDGGSLWVVVRWSWVRLSWCGVPGSQVVVLILILVPRSQCGVPGSPTIRLRMDLAGGRWQRWWVDVVVVVWVDVDVVGGVGGCGGFFLFLFFFPLLLSVIAVDLAGGGDGGWMWRFFVFVFVFSFCCCLWFGWI